MAGVELQVFSIDFQRRPYNTLALPRQGVMGVTTLRVKYL